MAFGVIAGVIYCTTSFFTSENPIYRIHPDIFDVTLVAIIIGFFVFQFSGEIHSSVIYNLGGTVAGMFYVAWLLALQQRSIITMRLITQASGISSFSWQLRKEGILLHIYRV